MHTKDYGWWINKYLLTNKMGFGKWRRNINILSRTSHGCCIRISLYPASFIPSSLDTLGFKRLIQRWTEYLFNASVTVEKYQKNGSEKISDSKLRKLSVAQLGCHRVSLWYPVTGQDTGIHLNMREKICLPVDVPKDKKKKFWHHKTEYGLWTLNSTLPFLTESQN